jgi:cobalamin biosynthetic protein CobC
LIAARARFAAAPEPFFDLSTGINPYAYQPSAWPEASVLRLPEPPEEHALLVAAARCYGDIDPAMVVAAPGTQVLINLLPLLFPHRRVGVLVPTYGEHLAVWGQAAVAVRSLDGLRDCDIGVLCHPNNPDGRTWPAEALLQMARHLAARGGFLLVDEAFVDFTPELSLARYVGEPGLLLLRSFGKTFGLAGLRLGFALTEPARAANLRRALGPWAVSGPAIWAGCQALADTGWLVRAGVTCREAAARLDVLLAARGLQVIGGTPLFRLAQCRDAARLAEHLGQAGILVRAFADHETWLRFGLPGCEAAWTRLEEALSSVS